MERFVFFSFFATQIKQQVVALCQWPVLPILFSHCKYKLFEKVFFFCSENMPQLSPSFTMGLWLKFVFAQPTCRGRGLLKGVANHTHWCSHTGGRQPILNRATAAPWGFLGMQRLLIKMQNVRAFGAMEVVVASLSLVLPLLLPLLQLLLLCIWWFPQRQRAKKSDSVWVD